MIELMASSGHSLRVSDEAAAARWVARGYRRVEEPELVVKPARKATAKRASASKSKK